MYRLNILYWFLLPASILSIYFLNKTLSVSYSDFLGFAENKQTEVNLEYDVVINKVHVKTGDHVKKGAVLLEVTKSDMDAEIRQLDYSMDELNIKTNLTKREIESEILALENEMTKRITELESKLNTSTSESAFYKSLLKNSSNLADSLKNTDNPNQEYQTNIQREINIIRQNYQNQINHYRKLGTIPQTMAAQKNQVAAKKSYLISEKNKFTIVAPYDGIVGNLNIREGESVKGYTSLISFYETTPPTVTGYIHEKFDGNVQVGSRVLVTSLFNPNKKSYGNIISKGHRIIEIPEKFRKIPDVKTYGIEVFVSIPAENQFYQKEVLKIQLEK